MVHTSTLTKVDVPSPSGNDFNGQQVRNKILLGLPTSEWAAILPRLKSVLIPSQSVLNEIGEPIESAFFMNDGLASVLISGSGNKTVEVGLCGNEGFIGIPLTVGFSSNPSRVIMQVDGSGFRIAARDFVVVLRECPTLRSSLHRFAQEMALQSSQIAACNRLHAAEEQIARWLLMCQDRLGGNVVSLTQDLFAHILGTRRATVTVAAGILQKAGIITYTRGSIKVESRSCLEDAACECYAIMTRQVEKWRSEVVQPPLAFAN